ncbi:CAP domain-containing protein [Streptomyces sp. APSN-46.1]|uniref:CAP domain-containing protein n=1 Tax=Streptomyces sp. APSN-46.1 TaxID=2929049 RepID=UPI001FB53ABE|nr:CAP domain-containing protein [Streptomyces sp. APSN-46.1]MCJ1676324.1 CAP domain-containing protein [Streptomyces sp. APSN-46.1]
MSRSRTPGTPSRVEARRKKTVRTRIVLSLTAAAAAVAVGVAVADSDDGVRASGPRSGAAGSGGEEATATPSPADPTRSADAASATGVMPSATPAADATGSAAPTKSAAESRPATSASTRAAKPAQPVKPSRTPAATTDGGSGGPGGSSGESGAESAVLALVNKERAAAGCGALTANAKLSAAARAYSDTMARSGVMSHTGPDGSTMTTRVEAAGYGWSRLGENIARGQADAAAVMNAWMNSPGHKANILNCDFREIGIGLHKGDGGPWWTQNFGTPK